MFRRWVSEALEESNAYLEHHPGSSCCSCSEFDLRGNRSSYYKQKIRHKRDLSDEHDLSYEHNRFKERVS